MAESFNGVDAIAAIPVDTVREALRATMVLGLPVDDAHKPTFYFDPVVDYTLHDSEGTPWDLSTPAVSETTQSPVTPIVAYEFFSPLGRQGGYPTEVGDFSPTTMIVTLLEDEWAQVRGFSYLTVGPSDQRWFFRYWRPAYGLGDMTVYQIHCSAEGVL